MKKATIVRLLFIVAIVLSIWNWTPEFLHIGSARSAKWSNISLHEIIEVFPLIASWDSYYLNHLPITVAALICGILPVLTGLLGIFRPGSKALFFISIATCVLVVVSVTVIYMNLFYFYGERLSLILKPGIGTYIMGVIVAIEVSTGIISRRQLSAQSPS